MAYLLLIKTDNPQNVILLSMCLCGLLAFVVGSENVYFDKYGHCSKTKPFDLSDEEYEVKSKGGGFYHENKDCSLSFKASPGTGACLTFEDFNIEDCSVQLLIYEAKNTDAEIWKEFSCDTEEPSRMCTSERYITMRVLKKRLNGNKGYEFEIKVEQSNALTDEGVVFASIGLVIGIIFAVVIVIIIISFTVYCCCRKREETSVKHIGNSASDHIEPSAPPLMEANVGMESTPLYPPLQEKPMLDPPPPYEQPPSYSCHNNIHS